jgi:hypothetical protein
MVKIILLTKGAERTFIMIGRASTLSRRTTWLALFLVTLQALVSAWHVHNDELRRPAHAASAKIALTASATTAKKQPISPTQRRDSDDDCLICLSLHLATFSLIPATLVVLAPVVVAQPYEIAAFSFDLPVTPYRLFHTRAPPAGRIGSSST